MNEHTDSESMHMVKSNRFLFIAAILILSGMSAFGNSQFDVVPGSGPDPTASADHQAVNPDWKLVWSDEFDGDSLDETKWNVEFDGRGGGNNELQYYTRRPENVRVEGGNLVLTAIKEDFSGPDGKRQYTSGKITSKGKGDWLYGRFEARIKLLDGRGYWPAFWMMPTDATYGGWAASGEIDIMEEVGHQPNMVYGTLHYGGGWPKNVHTGDKFVLPSGKVSDDFHVYAVEWEKGVMRWYVDGVLYQTQTKWNTEGHPFPAPFDKRFYMMFNLAVGGGWPGPPDGNTVFPGSMLVDYVRVYQP